MNFTEMAQEQEVARWRWHEIDEAADASRYDNMGEFLWNSAVANVIRTEYAFLWN